MSEPSPAAVKPIPKAVLQAGSPDASKAMTLFVMIVATLYFGREVLVPVTLALLLTFILAPLVDLLRRLHLGRVPSVLLGVIVALGIVLAIGGVIGTQIAQLSADAPKYAEAVQTKISTVKEYTVGRISSMADNLGAGEKATANPASRVFGARAASAPAGNSGSSANVAEPSTASPMDLAERYLAPVLSPLATFGIVFVITVFALLQREDLRDRLIRLVGSDDLHRTTLAMDDGGHRLSKFFLFQLGLNTGFGIAVGIGLFVIGVPNPILWGILSALLRFVPYVGSAIAALLPMALAAAVEPGWTMLIWTAVLYVALEGMTGQVLEPLLYGHSTGLSPFSVVVAAIFWSWIWGPIGLILSTPLTLCLVVMGRHVKRLQFLDVLLGDRPALTPVESFYQRVLAEDADEAQDHAELILKERSLSTYYDEVALKGLQLAANDAARGVLDEDQLDRVKATVKMLVDGLKDHEDLQPSSKKADNDALAPSEDEQEVPRNPDPEGLESGEVVPHPWSDPSSVLCIAGRGPLDEAAASMLVQLLGKHGMGGRLVGYGEVSRETIQDLDMTGVAMACVSYLDISGSPAHLRYLMQRLRQRLPTGAPILVGLWPAEDSTLTDRAIQQSIGADIFATSLAGTVSSCVEAARTAAGRSPEPVDTLRTKVAA
jgi:predicted PurR-regulated permease PerM